MLESSLARLELPRGLGTWSGSSRAGMATAFRWGERNPQSPSTGGTSTSSKIQFDAGLSSWPSRPKHLFLTHTHADHVQCLCQELMRGKTGRGSGTVCNVYFPASAERAIAAHLRAFYNLVRDDDDNGHENDNDAIPNTKSLERFFNVKLNPVAQGRELRIERDIIVRVVELTHRKMCNGYGLWREKKKLNAEFVGRDGAELGALKKQGVEISNLTTEPLFLFLGDTRPDVFHNHPELLQTHRIVVMECTFVDDPSRAVETGHTDWCELEPILVAHPHVLFVLQHFSVRHPDSFWERLLKDYNLKSAAANAHLMLPGDVECFCFQCKPKEGTVA